MIGPDDAALALRDDPTFSSLTREEQEIEAALLVGDDPLDVALAIEAALAAPVVRALPAGPGLEACRLNGADGPPCNGNEPIAGNGRCMTCGAIRRVAEKAPEKPVQADSPPAATRAPSEPVTASTPVLRHGVTYDPGQSFIGRFKEATGATDRETASMLGMSRATAQAYASGRLPEKLDEAQARVLLDDLAERLLLLADLKRDIAKSLGDVE